MIEIEHLFKDYSTRTNAYRALSDVSLSLPDTGLVSILGPSGCGKTTLLNLIGALDTPTMGEIRIDGHSLSQMDEKEKNSYRNDDVGFIFQEYFLLPQLNVFENVKLPLLMQGKSDEESKKRAWETLRQVKIENLAEKKTNELSGGESQRVAVTRALATDPRLLLCDEPTGALDSENSSLVMDLLKKASQDRLVLVVTHNEELARTYSDRIVTMKDGMIEDDGGKEKTLPKDLEVNPQEKRSSHLPFRSTLKMAFQNLWKKRGKTILTTIANAFGMIGIGFLLALNTGFRSYSQEINRATASSMPVIVTSYTTISDSEARNEVNANVLYPDVDEIYPSIDAESTTAYVYNNFTDKYFSYLDSLVEEGLASEYVINYGNSYSMNLITETPSSLDGTNAGEVSLVDTTRTNGNSITSLTRLPTSIFHSLYGSLDDYDLIVGSLPKDESELVLVVDEYNSIPFDILKSLGFYNEKDEQDDVRNPNLESHVKPISFDTILNKKYKVFSNDGFYQKTEVGSIEDAFGNTREMNLYSSVDLQDAYEDKSQGKTLSISGILRPRKETTYGLLSPSLCFLPELQKELVQSNKDRSFAKELMGHVVFAPKGNTADFTDFVQKLQSIVENYESSLESETTVFPTEDLRSLLDQSFAYFDYKSGAAYTLSSFVYQAKILGIDLLPESMRGLSLSDTDEIENIVKQIASALEKGDTTEFYSYSIGLSAYVNAYSLIDTVTILPKSLSLRDELLLRLDSFNEIQPNSSLHASSNREQVFYSDLNRSAMLSDVGDVIDMVSLILIIFSVISLLVSCTMTAILTMNSVLERKKEIGLLRSLGARKKDILSLFELETLLTGVFVGVFGALATYALAFPINLLIESSFPSFQTGEMAQFTFPHALILLLIALVISFLSALFPSLKAARQDPVDCLKSE